MTGENRELLLTRIPHQRLRECCAIVRNKGDVHKWSNGRAVIQETSAAVGDGHSLSDNSQPEKPQTQCHLSTDILSDAQT